MTRKKLMGMAVVTTLIIGMSSASAYIVPAEALMDRANNKRRRLDIAGITMQGVIEREGVRSQLWEAIRPDARRRELRRGEETKVVLDLGRQRYEYTPGSGAVPPARGPIDLLPALSFPTEADKGGIRGITLLRGLGIDTSVVSLGRQNRRIVYVIGAMPNETNKPQLWLDKELMVPVRLVQYDRSRVRRETRWIGFDSPLTTPFYPRRIETWVDGELSESVTYFKIEVNPKLDDALFAPPT